MSTEFTEAEKQFLGSSMSIFRAWFAEITMPDDSIWRVHTASGRKVIDGVTWEGVGNPDKHQLISVGDVVDSRFGETAKMEIILSGFTSEFLASIKEQAANIEGQSATIYWACFDPETETIWPSGLKLLFRGKLSAPSRHWGNADGQRFRIVNINIESEFSAINFEWGGLWNYSGQLERYPGDQGLQFVGVDVQEVIVA
ncbi:transcriptional regulator [Martelella limonii]|uniref:transcriptional regulator n=1 Tax=Martelella limonii TaxID=1647649 RepID=UPI001580CF44|nr:transcriptional regulator [Martelella limonii]